MRTSYDNWKLYQQKWPSTLAPTTRQTPGEGHFLCPVYPHRRPIADELIGGHREGESPIDHGQLAIAILGKLATVLAQPNASSMWLRCEMS